MPSRAKTPCSKCRVALIPVGSGGLCDGCRKDKRKHYNAYQRDQASQAFYNSGSWRKLRNTKLRNDPLCEMCEARGLVAPAALAHHKVERSDGGSDTLDNLMSLCNACHESLHTRFDS